MSVSFNSDKNTPMKKRTCLGLLLLTFCLLAGDIAAQEDPLEKELQKAIDAATDETCPGISAAILRDGVLSCNVVSGIRRVDEPENLITLNDKFHLGSCTKAMTATLAGILVDEGKLSWNETIAERFPKWSNQIAQEYHDVTLWQLITHRGGVPSGGPFWLNKGVSTIENRLSVIQKALEPAPRNIGKYGYSNIGYMLVGAFAENATEKSWEELIHNKLFEPLDMQSAGFGAPSKSKPATHPFGHGGAKSLTPTAHDNAPALGPAGTVHCSMSDWAKFVALHLDKKCEHHKILSPETLAKLHQPYDGDGPKYAGGWLVSEIRGGANVIGHSGSNTFWLSSVAAVPEKGVAIILGANSPPNFSNSKLRKIEQRFLRKLTSD